MMSISNEMFLFYLQFIDCTSLEKRWINMIIFTNLMIGLAQWADKSSLFRVQFGISIRHSLLCCFLCLLQSVRQVYRIHRASDENEGRWTCQEAPEKHQEEKKDKHNLGSNFCCFLRLMGPSQFVFHII